MTLDRGVPTDIDLVHRPMPPIAYVGMISMACVVAGGIYLAAHIPNHVSLAPAVALLCAATGLLLVNVVLLTRLKDFAWHRFFQVAKWMQLAYIVIAGMIEYVFVYDHTRGRVLAVLTLMLVVFALDIPVILGFTVARYQPPGD
jgi:hypothetical protein